MEIKVKDLIKYLTDNFDMEAEVILDKDCWVEGETADEIINNSCLFDEWKGDLIINN